MADPVDGTLLERNTTQTLRKQHETPGSVRILHLEDSPTDAEVIRMMVESGERSLPVTIDVVTNKSDYFSALMSGSIDLILCDWQIPGYDGAEALKLARQMYPDVPVIVVTGEMGEERAIETLKAGAADFVLKDGLRRLVPSIKRALKEAEDQRERKRVERELKQSNERLALLSETAAALLASPDPQAVVQHLCMKVTEHLKCDVFFNFLVEGTPPRLHLNAYGGIPEGEARKIEWLEFGSAVCGTVARERKAIVKAHIQTSDDPLTFLVRSYGVQAYASHPLLAGERVLGTLSFGTRSRPRFDAHEIELMRGVTDQVAIAMERLRTVQALKHLVENLRLMVEFATKPRMLVSGDGTIEAINSLGAEMLGYHPQDLEGSSVMDLMVPLTRMELMLRLNDLRTNAPEPASAVLRVCVKGGTTQWVTAEARLLSAGTDEEKFLVQFEKMDLVNRGNGGTRQPGA